MGNRQEFLLFPFTNTVAFECGLDVIDDGDEFHLADVHASMRGEHASACVMLRTAGTRADEFGDLPPGLISINMPKTGFYFVVSQMVVEDASGDQPDVFLSPQALVQAGFAHIHCPLC